MVREGGGGGGGSQVPFSNPNFVQILESHSTFASNPIPSGKDAWSNSSIACVQMFSLSDKGSRRHLQLY